MDQNFQHRQSLPNAARYSTAELTDLQTRIGQAAEMALAIELQLFDELSGAVLEQAGGIFAAADGAACLDVGAATAALASDFDWRRPEVDESQAFQVAAGRHPVVEAALRSAQAGAFVPNDCDLGTKRLWLLTGPNMAGKSTFLRQNALIAVLAQAGLYVPATAAHLGVVDALYSRVGAADDLARGRSTFMVEMVETAAILNQAGPRALVILDEIGRGTATFDGLSIAWAAVEHLHEVNRCRALFATHYHELTALGARLGHLANHAMRVKEWKGDVVFLHEVVAGAADRSYGIQVGKLAGLPASVITRAAEVLRELEKSGQSGAVGKLIDDLPLFSAPPALAPQPSEIERLLAAARLDDLSPRQALELLYQLKALIKKD
jgi:DNA mismatch repair protein MutS